MQNKEAALLFLILSLVTATIKMLTSGRRDPIGFILLFYVFFAFGPVINYLLGLPIYFGIIEKNIGDASLIMFLGVFSFSFLHLFFPGKSMSTSLVVEPEHQWCSLKYIFIASITYGLIRSSIMLPFRISGADKVELINLALPSIHYIYLLIQLYLTAFYFNIRKYKDLSILYWINLGVYVAYCLIISERDFIFPIFSILVIKMITTKGSSLKYLIGSLVLVVIATMIFFIRDLTQSHPPAIVGILNQGSILFINSFVLKILEDGQAFFYGKTYLNSLINLLPSWIYKTDFNTLEWFHNLYAPASKSGYGYALDAEAYMNFGYGGVISFFTCLGLYWKLLISRFNRSHFFIYLTVFSTGFCMYSLRNDSLALFKGTLYAGIIYLFVNSTSYLLSIWRKS